MILFLNTARGNGNHMKQINEWNMSFMYCLENVMFCVFAHAVLNTGVFYVLLGK